MINIEVRIGGLKELEQKFGGLPPMLRARLAKAGTRYAPILLDTQGVRKYPPIGPGNLPPTPYYIRGLGTQYATGNKGESEQAGLRFTVETRETRTTIGNTASYGQYLWGVYSQARAMARIGWKKLIDAARETQSQMAQIYAEEVENALKALRLK